MYTDEDYRGLVKVAFRQTVGDVINAMNADMTANAFTRRQALDAINRSHLSVKDDAQRLMYSLGGGVVANFVARYLGAGWPLRAVATAVGAHVGRNIYNKVHPNTNSVLGYSMRVY